MTTRTVSILRTPPFFALLALLAVPTGCHAPAASTGDDGHEVPVKIPPKPPEYRDPGPEALDRRARSEARLKAEGVKINANLPVIATGAETTLRTKDAAVDRAIALVVTAAKGEGLEQQDVDRMRKGFGADAFFSPAEKRFVSDLHASDADRTEFVWRYECVGVMLWALGFDADLKKPDTRVDAGRIATLFVEKGPATLREQARLRSARELLDEADVIYRYDWACVDARLAGTKPAGNIDCEIVVERHRALNWLIGYQGQDWDDVSTDT